MSYIPSALRISIMIPAEQSCFWAFLFSPWVLWALCHLPLHYHWDQHYFLLGLGRMSASHCPSTDTAGSEDCSNTDTNTNVHIKTKDYWDTQKHDSNGNERSTYMAAWVIVETSLRIIIISRGLIILIIGCIGNCQGLKKPKKT